MTQLKRLALVLLLAALLAGCGAPTGPATLDDEVGPPSPLPTASLAPNLSPSPAAERPEWSEPTYEPVDLGEGALVLDVPVSWSRLRSDWAWSPAEAGWTQVGVRWADLRPPMEAEAVLLPQNSQVLGASELALGWGTARQFEVEVYGPTVQGSGQRAPVQSVERHVLVVLASGETRRAYDLYALAPTAEDLALVLPVLDRMVASAQVPTGVAPAAGLEPRTVQVFFSNSALDPNAENCDAVWPVERQVPAAAHPLDAALNELLAGPTPAEAAAGYGSGFSLDTANLLVDVSVQGDRAYVNLGDLRPLIPSVSSSCGSAQLLAQLEHTVRAAAPGVTRVLYAIEGSPQPFWEWLQMGCDETNDFCDPEPFQRD